MTGVYEEGLTQKEERVEMERRQEELGVRVLVRYLPNSPNGGMLDPGGTIGTFPRNGGRLMKGGNWGIPRNGGPYGKATAAAAAAAARPAALACSAPPTVGGVEMGERRDPCMDGEELLGGLEERNRFASEPVDMLALAMVGLAEEESRENESSAGGSDRIESRCRFIVRRSSTWLSSAGEVSPVFTLSFSWMGTFGSLPIGVTPRSTDDGRAPFSLSFSSSECSSDRLFCCCWW